MDEAFQNAIRPPSHFALKLLLAPFTLGHWFLLARWCPEFVDPENREGVNLPLAVVLCALPQETSAKVVTRRCLRWFFMVWGWRCRNLDLAAELTSFTRYLRESMNGPAYNRRFDRETGQANAPTGFWLASMLMAEFGMTRAEAMNTPCTLALSLYAARMESTGKIELASSRSRKLWEFWRHKRAATAPTTANN